MPDTTFDDMATLAPDSPALSPPFHRRRKSWARKVERVCCQTISYFPLLFVYGLTSWAVWVEVTVAFLSKITWLAYLEAGLGVGLYGLAVVSYTIAVFTDPGSPLDPRRDAAGRRKGGGYEGLPTYEDEESGATQTMSTVTAKSDGKARYCKKCRTVKPDRSHHCSSCGKCVLKMDHHCPWLATCAGLHNYKPFLLFLSYTSLFCWVCFGVSVSWVWAEIMDDVQMTEGLRVVNTILLAVLGGIIGLVLSGFTGWHIYLAMTGQTTIESLEKTRYLNPLRKNMEQQFKSQGNRHYLDQERSGLSTPNNDSQTLTEHLKEIHANALPGVLRPEEGEDSGQPSPSNTPAPLNMRRSYASMEAQREQDRYDAYLDELDSEKLPNAFDMGWQRNLLHVFGEQPLFWFLPICNTTGDGWQWEVSSTWTAARDNVARERAQRQQQTQWDAQHTQFSQSQPQPQPPQAKDLRWQPGQGFVNNARAAPPRATYAARAAEVPMQSLDRRKVNDSNSSSPDAYDTSSDEEQQQRVVRERGGNTAAATANWNDIPDDFLAPRGKGVRDRSRSRGRRKGD